jgi:hypothetical protein
VDPSGRPVPGAGVWSFTTRPLRLLLRAEAGEQLAGLAAPMSRLAGLSSWLDSPVRLILFSLIALLGWGIVTFLAVRLAIVSAGRRRGEGT